MTQISIPYRVTKVVDRSKMALQSGLPSIAGGDEISSNEFRLIPGKAKTIEAATLLVVEIARPLPAVLTFLTPEGATASTRNFTLTGLMVLTDKCRLTINYPSNSEYRQPILVRASYG